MMRTDDPIYELGLRLGGHLRAPSTDGHGRRLRRPEG